MVNFNSGDVGLAKFGNSISSMPETLRHRSYLWWRGQIIFAMLQPNARLDTYLRQTEAQLDIQHPCVAVHVRHGNRHTDTYVNADGFKEFGLMDHMAKVDALTGGAGSVRNVLLLTEDNAVTEEATAQMAASPDGYKYYWTKNTRDNTGVVQALASRNVWNEAMIGYTNLFLAAKCEYYVGALSSQFARLEVELMYLNGGATRAKDISSLDWTLNYVENTYFASNPY